MASFRQAARYGCVCGGDLTDWPTLTHALVSSAQKKALYSIDTTPADGLYGDFVLSTVATGNIVSVDPSPALAFPGVVAWISAKDIQPGAGLCLLFI